MLATRQIGRAVRQRRCFNIVNWYKENAKTPAQLRVKYDLEHGYWFEANQLAKYPDGKLFPSTEAYPIPSAKAHEFPLDRLGSKQQAEAIKTVLQSAPCSLLFVSLHRLFSDAMANSWKERVLAQMPSLPMHELVFTEGFGYRLISPYTERIVRQRIAAGLVPPADCPADSIPTSHLWFHYGNVPDVRSQLSLSNRYLIYPMLVDRSCRMRWLSIGKASDLEVNNLVSAAQKIRGDDRKTKDKST